MNSFRKRCTCSTFHMLKVLLFTVNDSASTGCAKANKGRAKLTKEFLNFVSNLSASIVVSPPVEEVSACSLLLITRSVAIFTNSRVTRPATSAVVVARAGTIRPAICMILIINNIIRFKSRAKFRQIGDRTS